MYHQIGALAHSISILSPSLLHQNLFTHKPTHTQIQMKILLVVCLLMVGILLSNTSVSAEADYCGNSCNVRCARAGVLDRCIKYCGICCAKCKCVPEGTYGNKHQCPCYRDMVNSKGKPKCP